MKNLEIIPVDGDDPQMVDAMQQARGTFAEFRGEVEADWRRLIPVIQSSMVKAYFADPEDPDHGEHLWVQYEGFTNEMIHGTLMSQPGHVKSVTQGDAVSFPLARLSDWLYVEDNTAHGAFTVLLLRTRMTAEEREQHDDGYPFRFQEK